MKTRRFTTPILRTLAALLLLAACCRLAAFAFSAATAPPPRSPDADGAFALSANMVLNRSFFLNWDEAPEENFGRYEVFAGPSSAPLPDSPTAVFDEAGRCYLSLRGLEPETDYTARVRLSPADGSSPLWSNPVRVTTLRDGYPEGTPPERVLIPTFMYHHVRPLDTFPPDADLGGWYSTESFERDLAWMRSNNVHGVTTADILDGRLPENPVFLTFDDGYTDFLEYAVPLLVKYGFPAANAVITRLDADQSTWAGPVWPPDTMMTWPQIRKCLRQGMEIGGHTQTHVNLGLHPDYVGQIQGSYDDLAAALGEAPLYFCYPWGMNGHDLYWAKNAVRDAGYHLATSTWPPHTARLSADRMFLPRQCAVQGDTLEDFIAKGAFPVQKPEPPPAPKKDSPAPAAEPIPDPTPLTHEQPEEA